MNSDKHPGAQAGRGRAPRPGPIVSRPLWDREPGCLCQMADSVKAANLEHWDLRASGSGKPARGFCFSNSKNLPALIAEGGAKPGQYPVFDRRENYPLSNFYITLRPRMGVAAAKSASGTTTMRGLERAGWSRAAGDADTEKRCQTT